MIQNGYKGMLAMCKPICMHPNVHCSTIYNSQDMEATLKFIDRGMGKENVVHICSGILLSHKIE